MYGTLIDGDTLTPHLGTPDWRILDCRFDLGKPWWGAAEYWRGHVPGASYVDLDRDLSSPITATSGRHPLPDPDRLRARLAALGIGTGTQVIVYDQGNGMVAARAWWLLRWLGHDAVAVLDGGYAEWLRPGSRPVSRDVVTAAPASLAARPCRNWVVSTADLAERVGQGLGDQVLCDARGADRYAGQNETIDPVAGHVPGALSMPFTGNLGPDGRFLAAAQLRERWAARVGDARRAIMMCGSGVSACHNLLALECAGLHGARLYAGSWSEWIRDPHRPVATGG